MEKIKHLLDMVAKECGGEGDGRWTEAIFKKMNHYARNTLGLEFYSKGHDQEGEWLFDAVFWINEQNGRHPAGIYCCIESEWQKDDQDNDFKKILVARTNLPVFITQAKNSTDAKQAIKYRLELAQKFAGEPQPIIFVWNGTEEKWHCNEAV